MSVLTRPAQDTATLTPEERKAIRVAQQVKRAAKAAVAAAVSTSSAITRGLIEGLAAVWESPDPAAVLAEIGTDAVEVFALSRDLAAYVIPTLTGKDDESVARIMALFALIPAYTENADGTVTINE